MTPSTTPSPVPSSPAARPAPAAAHGKGEPAAPRDLQRESLERIVTLSNECAAAERRIEQAYADARAAADAALAADTRAADDRLQTGRADLAARLEAREEAIRASHDRRRQELDASHQDTLRQAVRTREGAESAIKKEAEQIAWQAESAQVTFEMKVDAEEQQFNKDFERSKGELADLASLETAAHAALARYRIAPPQTQLALDAPLKDRLAADARAVLAEYREGAVAKLKELQATTRGGATDDVIPIFLVLLLAAGAGAGGWFGAPDPQTRLWVAGGAAAGGLVVGVVLWLILRHRKRTRVTARAKASYEPFAQTLGVARAAATLDPQAAAAERAQRVLAARVKRDEQVAAAREKAKGLLAQAVEQFRTSVAEENRRYADASASLDRKVRRAKAEVQQDRDTTTRQFHEADAAARGDAAARHAAATAEAAAAHDRETTALKDRWDAGLHAVSDLLSAGAGVDPRLLDWNSPAWDNWQPPAEFAGQVRFGELQVDLAQLTEYRPERLRLPDAFTVPAVLAMPARASLFVDADAAGRGAAIDLARTVMARLLTQVPAGRVKFTLFDPVGLGQSFAGFMHLADHDESLVGSRIWTEKEHILQRLADLTEHMETVIQKYLRNEYATIDEYNAQAGELAEPYRFLVIADFPTGFEQDALRRLASIAMTGPRCGVYTLILRDPRQPLPQGSRVEDVLAPSVHLVHKEGRFVWDDVVFRKFPLRVDPAPDEKALTRLMDVVGQAAKDAKRVEVPFASIAPAEGRLWSYTSESDLRVPIGKAGATRLQSMRLGVGVAQHALVAGKTGSGKSNLLHTVVTNLAMWYSPDEVEFYLVDFKKGVEFKAYVTGRLPHARAIAVESDREFGVSVLQRVDAELTRRGAMFRDAGVQDIAAFRAKTGQTLPRTVLLIDEFQEFFTEDDRLAQDAAGLLDRLVRQGRAFGVHLILGSQSIGGAAGLGRSTLGQIAVRVALQCSDADSQIILGDNNSAARLLSRPGAAIYNDAGGLVEANSPFQIAFLPDAEREVFLDRVRVTATKNGDGDGVSRQPIVFEGNTAAALRQNTRLMELLTAPAWPTAQTPTAYLGEPVAIKEPTSVRFRRQSGVNVLMVGQQEEAAVAIFSSMLVSLAAGLPPGGARFFIMDGSPADARHAGLLERVAAALPHPTTVVAWRDVPDALAQLAATCAERRDNESPTGPATFLFVFGLQRYRQLRKQEDDFSFSRGDEPAAPKPDRLFADLLAEGPGLGVHTVVWADTPVTVERTLDRGAMRQFDNRVLFQMSAADSSNLIDSPLANRLGANRALIYSEEQGTFEKFRPYEVPDTAWLQFVTDHLKNRPTP
jgi:hypothetical protein